jgi:cytochrome c-type biogenesis protein CcmH
MIWLVFAALTLAVLAVLIAPLFKAPASERRAGRFAALVMAIMLPLGAGLLYAALGHPRLPGQPYAERLKHPVFALQSEAVALAKRLEVAPDAEGFSRLGEILTEFGGGRVTGQAGEAFARALELDPGDPRARYYAGLALMQRGKRAEALAVWRDLERDSKPDAPWLPMLRQGIADAEKSKK